MTKPRKRSLSECEEELEPKKAKTSFGSRDSCTMDDNHWLLRSAQKGLVDEVKKAIDEGVDVNATDFRINSFGQTSLHHAAYEGHTEIVQLLLEAKADPNIKDKEGRTPLHRAGSNYIGRAKIVELLLEKNADPNVISKNGYYPITLCEHSETFEILSKVTEKKHFSTYLTYCHTVEGAKRYTSVLNADINLTDPMYGQTLLHKAVSDDNMKLVEYLLDLGANPNIKDYDGHTPLNLCYTYEYRNDCTKLLKKSGGTLNYNVLLLMSSEEGLLEKVKEALDHQANVDVQDRFLQTSLFIAVRKNNKNIIRLLLEHNANPNITDINGISSLHLAVQLKRDEDIIQSMAHNGGKEFLKSIELDMKLLESVRTNDVPEARAALEEGANVDVSEINIQRRFFICDTAVSIAAKAGHIEIVKLLIEQNADLNIGYEPPLLVAILYERFEIAKLLIETGKIDFNKTDFGGERYMQEANTKQSELLKNYEGSHKEMHIEIAFKKGYTEFLNHKLPTDYRHSSHSNFNGQTYLHVAAYKGHFGIAQLITSSNQILPYIKDDKGRSPLHFAIEYCAKNCVDFIKHYMENVNDALLDTKDNNGNTLLQLACIRSYKSVIEYLLSSPNVNPVSVNYYGEMPLESIGHLGFIDQLDIFDLFQPYQKSHIDYMVSSYVKIFICGNQSAGKSSLSEVIKYYNTHIFCKNPSEMVKNVVPETAGMNYRQNYLRQSIIYDFAGHKEYYSSHAAILESLLRSPAVFVLVTKMAGVNRESLEKNLYYWFNFILNVNAHLSSKSHVLVVGSYYDEFEKEIEQEMDHYGIEGFQSLENVQSLVNEIGRESLPSEMYRGFVPVTCNRLGSTYVGEFVEKLRASRDEVMAKGFDRMSYQCHALNIYLKSLKGTVVISLDDLSSRIRDLNKPCLYFDVPLLKSLLTTLCDKGLLLFLSNDQSEASWIILDQRAILEKVNGVLFNKSINRVDKSPVSNTGIVTVSALSKLFSQYDINMLVDFLVALEFCYKIDSDTLKSTNMLPLESVSDEELLYFPALVTVGRPSLISPSLDKSCNIGWCLFCSNPHQFLTVRYFQVLMFQLAYNYSLPLRSKAGKLERSDNSQGLERRCKVWKNGIYWTSKGIESIVEVSEHNRCVKVIVSGSDETNCLKQCSLLIHNVISLKEKLCSQIVGIKEYIILPSDVCNALDKEVSDLLVYDMRDVARAMLLNETVFDVNGLADDVDINVLNVIPKGEPYACVAPLIIRELHDDSKADCPLTKSALIHLKESCPNIMSYYVQPVPAHLSVKDHFSHFSIFTKRNPLDIAEPHLLEYDIVQSSVKVLKQSCSTEKDTELNKYHLYNLLCQHDCAHKWDEIGIGLQLSHGSIESLRRRIDLSDEMKLYDVIQLWQDQMTLPFTMKTIINVLKGPIVQKVFVANEMQKFYSDYSETGLISFIASIPKFDSSENNSTTYALQESNTCTFKNGKVGNGEKSEVTSQSSLNDKDLFKCGQCIDSDGLTLLAGILELDDETILEIQKKYKKLEIQVYWLLKKWKQSNPGVTKQDLIEIFEMLGFTKAIEKLTTI